jgi:hypothetical protein
MTVPSMTSRPRVEAAVNRRPIDRVRIDPGAMRAGGIAAPTCRMLFERAGILIARRPGLLLFLLAGLLMTTACQAVRVDLEPERLGPAEREMTEAEARRFAARCANAVYARKRFINPVSGRPQLVLVGPADFNAVSRFLGRWNLEIYNPTGPRCRVSFTLTGEDPVVHESEYVFEPPSY